MKKILLKAVLILPISTFSNYSFANDLDNYFNHLLANDAKFKEYNESFTRFFTPKTRRCAEIYGYNNSASDNCSIEVQNQSELDAMSSTGIKKYEIEKEKRNICDGIISKISPKRLGELDRFAAKNNTGGINIQSFYAASAVIGQGK